MEDDYFMFQKVEMNQFQEEKISDEQRRQQFCDLQLIEESSKKAKSLCLLLQQLEELEKNQEWERFCQKAQKTIRASESLTQHIRAIPSNFGKQDIKQYLSEQFLPEEDYITFSFPEEDVIHIKLKELLPRRLDSGKVMDNMDYVRYQYSYAFHKNLSCLKTEYQERVVILFRNFFLSETDMIDDDNFETKFLTDCIATYVLTDDNPKRCMKVYDYGISNHRHSEILIFPISKWFLYMEMPFV